MEYWQKYNGFLQPSKSPHIEMGLSRVSIFIDVLKHFALFARWYENFDLCEDGNFYFVIKDTFVSLEKLPSKNRREIVRGLEMCDVKQISYEQNTLELYQVYKKAVGSYEAFHEGLSLSDYCNYMNLKIDKHQVDFFGVFDRLDKKLIGYSMNLIQDRQVEYANVKFDPEYLKNYSSYSLFYKMNEFYLALHNYDYVNDGAKSIFHQSDIQDYLIKKHGFRKAFCKLNVVYHPLIWLIVKILYPFRTCFSKSENYWIRKFSSLLMQEEILRSNI